VSSPLVVQSHDSTTWHTGLGLVDDAMDVSTGIQNDSWVDGTLGGVGGALDMLSLAIDPLGTLVSWGVSWLMEHVKPLKDALDWLAGNADEVAAHAATWTNVAKFTQAARQEYADRLRSEVAEWLGASGDAYRDHAGAHLAILEGISIAANGISYAVQGAGLLVGLVRGIVRDLIADFIGTLAARLPQWLAEEGLTLGIATPVVIGQVAALVAKWVNKIQHFVRALLSSLRKLHPMLDKLGDIFTNLNNLTKKLSRSDPTSGGPHSPSSGGVDGPSSPDIPGTGWHEGDPIPPPHDGGGLPTDAHINDHYRGENDPTNPNRAFAPATVHYMTPEEREAHRLFVDGDGALRSARDGTLFDTTSGRTVFSDGRAIFVMDEHGNLYATMNQQVGHIHHSSLLAGDPVVGAGEIDVRGGQLVGMTDKSGHYHPLPEMNDQVMQSLLDQGLRPDPGFKKFSWGGQER
jgi:hypothetical protein